MSRRSPPPRRLSLLVLLLICVLIWFGSNPEFDTELTQSRPSNEEKPSSFVEYAKMTAFEGIDDARVTIESARAEFYDLKNEVVFRQPRLKLLDNSREGEMDKTGSRAFFLSSEMGRYDTSTGIISLSGNVRLREAHLNDENNELNGAEKNVSSTLIFMNTEQLTYNSKTNFISTEEAVNIKRGQTTISAIGMSVSIDNRKLTLHSQVRGKHVFET